VYLAAIEKKARVQKRWNTPNGGFGS